MVRDKIPDALISVMLYSEQEQTLNLIKEPAYFSREYIAALKDLKIGPNVGACGAAAYHRRLVVCEDLLNDPNWVAYKDLVKQNGLRACWSVPIANGSGKLLALSVRIIVRSSPLLQMKLTCCNMQLR